MKKKLGIISSIFLLVCTCFVMDTSNVSAAETVFADKVFQLDGQVFDYGQNIVSLRFQADGEVDLTTIDKDTFHVVASGRDPIDINTLGEGNTSFGAFEDKTRKITNVRLDDNDSSTIIIDMEYGQSVAESATLTYVHPAGRNLDLILDYQLTQNKDFNLKDGSVISKASTYKMGDVVDEEVDRFTAMRSTSGMNYQMYKPSISRSEKHPLVVWFHGNGEGGTGTYQNNTSQLLANRGGVAFASDEMQPLLDYPYVIAPQVDDTWYNNYSNGYIDKATEMVKEVVAENPNIDTTRIYIAGCSAGGYMTWHMMINNPKMFAAGVPICAAIDLAPQRGGEPTTAEQVLSLKDVPIWLVHSADDPTVSVVESSRWAYDLLKDYGAIYTEYTDVTVDGASYNGHWSWIYALRNMPENNGIKLMQWMGSQQKTENILKGSSERYVVEGFDWGPATTKIVLKLDHEIKAIHKDSLVLNETKQNVFGTVETTNKVIQNAYLSDANGKKSTVATSSYITIEPQIHPDTGTSPFTFLLSSFLNIYSQPYELAVTIKYGSEIEGVDKNYDVLEINPTANNIDKPLTDKFTKATYTGKDMSLSYASYAPAKDNKKNPLIIWLHGAGEGGNDPEIILLGNKVTALVDDEIQDIMDGAYVLTPQSPTMWMDDGSGNYTTDGTSMYTEVLMELIEDYVEKHPDIDPNRIYIGGCSNGGYMTMNMLFNYPTYFAAAFPICEAYTDAWINDNMITRIKDIPMWFTQSKDDTTVPADTHIVATYQRLQNVGAKDIHLSLFDTVVDTSGKYQSLTRKAYQYNGHWSWVYTLNNECIDNDETIFAWLARQRKAGGTSDDKKTSTTTKAPSTGSGNQTMMFTLLCLGSLLTFISIKRKANKE
ncbi:putative peptidase [Breznakia sp. PF5-3]|uniref:prolyl oligopeptidase family serine peptidase n=1 Tax=unclassified Breznakia TaxID=2623764 RepID=UPI00240571A6|nr:MULTISPECIES: prolyl oligopeptidase family serine peptidase [unclassified Breznakia]MDF9825837.1 putative peptidase [Breznakia sp. PM6-1]MDF9836642.1 putative peptidase [Breznakia sp. PF5-3]MDF9838889.1 putative peptidase [Breznakia sp. PFB2-8]MDF9860915.1 putative peptidase [Breznakia sp. PH5-24]